jgi:Domain of unknown function (DUF4394)
MRNRSATRGPLQIVGLTADQRLICFTQRGADRARTIGSVSNLQMDTSLVEIDYRPADGNLYGVGNQGGIYTVDVTTAQATLVSRTNVALNGTFFGTDFNHPKGEIVRGRAVFGAARLFGRRAGRCVR